MSYYRVLGLEAEPFSTSPDPAFFYQSKEHTSALYRLRIAIELKRGLSLIIGDVGTGKTTLSRRLAQLLKEEPKAIMAMVLNPYYESEKQFLADLAERFHIEIASAPSAPRNDGGTGMPRNDISGTKGKSFISFTSPKRCRRNLL